MATKRDGCPCYEKADLDEPIFTLRAKDRLAPIIVRLWAMLADMSGAPKPKTNGAIACAMQMEDWAARHGNKFPD